MSDLNYHNYPPNSKVWVYQAKSKLTNEEVDFIRVRLDEFISEWESHGNLLKADFDIFYNLFVVIFVDEQGDNMCGRAQDASVKLMKELEAELETTFLNRMNVAYRVDNENINLVSMDKFTSLAKDGTVNENTLVFNNTVTTKKEFDDNWEVPVKDSWHKQLI